MVRSPSVSPSSARAQGKLWARSAACTSGTIDAGRSPPRRRLSARSEEHTSELQSRVDLVCRLLLEKKKIKTNTQHTIIHYMENIQAMDGYTSARCRQPLESTERIKSLRNMNVYSTSRKHTDLNSNS